MQKWLTAMSDSGFFKLDAVDWKHLGIEALLAAGLAGVGVFAAHLSNHDVGFVGPALAWGLVMGTNLLKKLMTDNESKFTDTVPSKD